MINSILEPGNAEFPHSDIDVLERQNVCSPLLPQVHTGFIRYFELAFNLLKQTKKNTYRFCYGIRWLYWRLRGMRSFFSLIYQLFPFDLICSMATHWYRFSFGAKKQKRCENTLDFADSRKTMWKTWNMIKPELSQVLWFGNKNFGTHKRMAPYGGIKGQR